MALTEPDRALLELLLDPRQDYSTVADLLGSEPAGVRSRAAAALGALGGLDAPVDPALSDWVLGLAATGTRGPDFANPATAATAGALVGAIATSFPGVETPRIPTPEVVSPPALRRRPGSDSGPIGPGAAAKHAEPGPLPDRVAAKLRGLAASVRLRPRLYGALGLGLVLIAAVAVAVFVSGGGSDGPAEGESSTSLVALRPLEEGSRSTGEALFLQAGKQALAQVELRGLAPTRKGESYVVWLYSSEAVAYPLARDVVGKKGTLGGPAPVPVGLRPPLDTFGCLDVSLASDQTLGETLTGRPVAGTHVGKSVLRGEIRRQGETAASGPQSRCQRTRN